MTTDSVALRVGGLIYEGWTHVDIETSLTTISGEFSLSVTERWPGQQAAWAVAPGMACSVAIGETVLITGYINDREVSYDDGSHRVTLRGRDKTGDLVDCAAVVDGVGSWNSVSVMEVGRTLLKPFGIKISSTVSDTNKVLAAHGIQLGETVWECLERAIRQYGVLAMTDGSGNLVLTRPGGGPALAEVRLGGNILEGNGRISDRETFRDYYVLGQFPGSADSYSDPRITNGASGRASDPNVERYRPTIVQVECNTGDMTYLPTRARWEAAWRSGRARQITVLVQGWRDAAGAVYRPNSMIRLEDGFMGVHESLLVDTVRLTIEPGGQMAELTLTRKEAFIPEPLTSWPPYDPKGAP